MENINQAALTPLRAIVQGEQFSGWFKALGSTGVLLNNILTIVNALVLVGVGGFFVIKAIHIGIKLSSSHSPQERAENKKSLLYFVIGAIVAIALPTIAITLFQTVGKTVKVSDGGGSKETLFLNYFDLSQLRNLNTIQIPNFIYN